MAARTVVVDGFTYEGRWLRYRDGRWGHLHVRGPLEYRRPTSGSYGRHDGEWTDGPTGRSESPRSKRWWAAARQLLDLYGEDTYQGRDHPRLVERRRRRGETS